MKERVPSNSDLLTCRRNQTLNVKNVNGHCSAWRLKDACGDGVIRDGRLPQKTSPEDASAWAFHCIERGCNLFFFFKSTLFRFCQIMLFARQWSYGSFREKNL